DADRHRLLEVVGRGLAVGGFEQAEDDVGGRCQLQWSLSDGTVRSMSIVSAGSGVSHTLGFADQTEEVRVDALPVEGEVPAWLHGGLVRVTPAQMDFEKRSVTHWFDGMAMLNR